MPDRRKVSRAAIAHSGEPHASSLLRVSLSSALDPSRPLLTYLIFSIGCRRHFWHNTPPLLGATILCGGEGEGDAPAPKASGWLSAKRELRSSRKGLRDASEEYGGLGAV